MPKNKEKRQKGAKKPPTLRLGSPAAHPSNAYCCFRQDLTGFTPMHRTGPNLHRASGKCQYTVFLPKKQVKFLAEYRAKKDA